MISMPFIKLGERHISSVSATYIVAEVGVNHNGDILTAHKMIDAAKKSGADAVKFQTFRTDELILSGTQAAPYQQKNTSITDQKSLLHGLELPFEDFVSLRDHCVDIGIDFMSTAFDSVSLEFVVSLDPICLKWPSGELTNWPLLRQARQSGLPLLLSTGMGSLTEISAALDQLGSDNQIVILQCVSDYPARLEDQNLRVLPALQAAFGCPVGFSDHTLGPYAALAARALGMAVLEKHFTLDNRQPGPDHKASTEPDEFAEMVKILRQLELGLGDGLKRPDSSDQQTKKVVRKSLVYRKNLACGHLLTSSDLTAKRPGSGISPDQIDRIVGLTLSQSVLLDDLVEQSHVR